MVHTLLSFLFFSAFGQYPHRQGGPSDTLGHDRFCFVSFLIYEPAEGADQPLAARVTHMNVFDFKNACTLIISRYLLDVSRNHQSRAIQVLFLNRVPFSLFSDVRLEYSMIIVVIGQRSSIEPPAAPDPRTMNNVTMRPAIDDSGSTRTWRRTGQGLPRRWLHDTSAWSYVCLVNTGNNKTYKNPSELPRVNISSDSTNITLSCFAASSLQSHILVLGLASHKLRAVTSSAFSTADQQVKECEDHPTFPKPQEPNIHPPLGLEQLA